MEAKMKNRSVWALLYSDEKPKTDDKQQKWMPYTQFEIPLDNGESDKDEPGDGFD